MKSFHAALSLTLALLTGAAATLPPEAAAAVRPMRPLSDQAGPDAMSPCADCPPPRAKVTAPRRVSRPARVKAPRARRVVRKVQAAKAAPREAAPPAIEYGLPMPVCDPDRPVLPGVCPVPRCELTPEELATAKTAWAYFEKNIQPETGLCNATDGYPSVTMWDQGSALYATFAARQLGLITQERYDQLIRKALSTLSRLKLYDNQLPNKAYNTKTGQMVDYANKPSEQGIGVSPLDLGRLISALQAIRACDVASRPMVDRVMLSWDWKPLFEKGQMMGVVRTGDKAERVQEGRLGYQEYANEAFQKLGVAKLAEPPVKFVRIYGVDIPVDPRDPLKLGAHTYVVSESYILGAMEFGLSPKMADWARRVFEVQRRRYEATGQPTAVSEDHIDRAPHFVYNTVWTDGYPWRAITDKGEDASPLKSVSTKAAYGWYALFNTPYSNLLWQTVQSGAVKDKGYYAGLYEDGKGYNAILTANTNGIILQALLYQKAGRPLVSPPRGTGLWEQYRREVADLRGLPGGRKLPPTPVRKKAPLTTEEQRMAKQAWAYFKANAHPVSGLAPSRAGGATVDMATVGDQLVALAAAERFGLIGTIEGFDRHERILRTLKALPLAGGAAPASLYTTDGAFAGYDGKPRATPLGWDAFHLGRLLTGLAAAAVMHPELVDETTAYLETWRMSEIVRQGRLYRADDNNGQLSYSAQRRVGAEQYAAMGFALWGVKAPLALSGTEDRAYHRLGTQEVPMDRTASGRTTSEPWLLAMLDHGNPGVLGKEAPYLYHAQWERSRQLGKPIATGTGAADREPWLVTDTLVASGQEWETFGPDGKAYPRARGYSAGVALGWASVYDTPYATRLNAAVKGLENPKGGWFRGRYESGDVNKAVDARTSALVLESMHFKARGPLVGHWDRVKTLTNFKGLTPAAPRPSATPTFPPISPASPGAAPVASPTPSVRPAPQATPGGTSRFPVTVVSGSATAPRASARPGGPVATPVPGATPPAEVPMTAAPASQTGIPIFGWRAPDWLQAFNGRFSFTMPLTFADPFAGTAEQTRQGVANPFPQYQAFGSGTLQYTPYSYFFGRLTAFYYLDPSSQQPWNPDFSYAFGYSDWHPGSVNLTYENYAGNRWSSPASQFLNGSIVLTQRLPALTWFPEPLGNLAGAVSYSLTPRFIDDTGATRMYKHGLHGRLDYRVFQYLHFWFSPHLYPQNQQQPWDPDFTYGFGLNDWRPFTLAIEYANYSGTRWPWRPQNTGGGFFDGNVTFSGSWGF